MPHWVPLATGISSIRLSHVSAMYRSPAESNASPCGWFSTPRPSALDPATTVSELRGRHRYAPLGAGRVRDLQHPVPHAVGDAGVGRCSMHHPARVRQRRVRLPAHPLVGAHPVQRVNITLNRADRAQRRRPVIRPPEAHRAGRASLFVCCCAVPESYVRLNDSAGPKVGMDTSVSDWVRSPFSVFTDPAAERLRHPMRQPGSTSRRWSSRSAPRRPSTAPAPPCPC